MLTKILGFAATSVGITGAIALGMIASQRPLDSLPDGAMSFEDIRQDRVEADMQLMRTAARDGSDLTAWHLPADNPDAPLMVLVHGSGWHGGQFKSMAADLQGNVEILAVNLRGHFNGPGQRGDVAYLGQLEDDLADLIAALRKPGQKVVLGGHSSGGGLVVRFAGGQHREMIDAALLLAPFLKYNAPTTRPNSGGWAHVLTRRIIGLSMLNTFKIHALDHLTVIQFAMPQDVQAGATGQEATLAYSWRLNQSYAPRGDYLADIAKLPPFLLIAGSNDESFVAQGFEPLMSEQTDKGRYHVLEGANHLGVVLDARTVALIQEFLNEL